MSSHLKQHRTLAADSRFWSPGLFFTLKPTVVATTAFFLLLVGLSTAMASESEVASVSDGNSKFASKFYQLLAEENKNQNIFFSPLSAHVVLSLAYQGAGGKTAEKLSQCLHVSDKQRTASGYNTIIDSLNNVGNVTLHVANKVFVMDSFPLKETFKRVAKESFLSEAQSVNFADNTKAAALINGWVEDKTNSKIKDLISADALNSLTRLVLVNAVYFKGNWAHKFDKQNTLTEPFHTSKDTKIDCQMMHLTEKFRFTQSEELDAKIVELPYENRDVSMLVILPNEIDGIEKLESKLATKDLSTLTQDMYEFEVELSLPKFKFETSMELRDLLTKMDAGVIFNPGEADFSEFSDSPEPLYVSKVIQKAFIEVNEEGAEAAAATGLQVVLDCLTFPQIFQANHPFVIALRHCNNKNGDLDNILFYGRVLLPGV